VTDASDNVPAPRRRWFQYSLRTLFVLMTVVALWLAWELSFIRERQAWLRENPALVDQDAALSPVPLAQIVTPPVAADASSAPMLTDINVPAASSDLVPASAPNSVNATYVYIAQSPPRSPREATIPFWRRMLGDTAVAEINAPDEWTDAERAHVTKLFPEAELVAPLQFAITTATGTFSSISAEDDSDDGTAEDKKEADRLLGAP